MTKPTSLPRTIVLRILFTLLLPGVFLRASEPGGLDPTFVPPQTHQGPHRFLVVVGPHVYLPRGNGVERLSDNGGPDPEWHPNVPFENPPESLVPTPWGGFLVEDVLRTYLVHPDGTFLRFREPSTQWFPQADGSFLRRPRGGGVARLDPDGRVIEGYALRSRTVGVSFVNPSGSYSIGGGGPRIAVGDRRGRLIVGGTFVSSGGLDRPGLVRLLPDGRPDPAWNPGVLLGIAPTNAADPEILANLQITPPTNFITARPSWMVLGTNDSVVVGIEYVAPRGAPDRRIAVIGESGEISALFPNESLTGVDSRCVQPDGRLLIAEHGLSTWRGIPVGKVMRLEPDGTLDTSFQVTLDPPEAWVSAMTLDERGRLWISGSFTAVNGVPRPGLARLFACDPVMSAPELTATVTRRRIAEGESLYLSAQVSEGPFTHLQWFRDGIPVPGAVFPTLRLPVTPGALPAEFQLRAWNSLGTNVVNLGRTEIGTRSPRPGATAPPWSVRLDRVFQITRLVPLPDGKILFGTGMGGIAPTPLVGRLTRDGQLDAGFGNGGLVEGDGRVEDLLPQPDGSVWVVGSIPQLAGSTASGMAELSPDGQRIARSFPELDSASVTTALALPNGQWIIAGRFSRVNGVSRFRLARLKSDLSLDPDFDASASFEPWQVVDVLALDAQGRLLAAGASFAAEGGLTNPVPYGLARLLPNGALDPEFSRVPAWGRTLFVEPDGSLITGLPLQRWSPDGRIMTPFLGNLGTGYLGVEPDHRLVRLTDGSFVGPYDLDGIRLRRWLPDGQVDDLFENPFTEQGFRPRVTAAAALPDGSALIAVADGRGGALIRRLAPDSDLQLADPQWTGGELRAGLYTQSGRRYQMFTRDSLTSPPRATGEILDGDGYLTPVGTRGSSAEGYLQVIREPVGKDLNGP